MQKISESKRVHNEEERFQRSADKFAFFPIDFSNPTRPLLRFFFKEIPDAPDENERACVEADLCYLKARLLTERFQCLWTVRDYVTGRVQGVPILLEERECETSRVGNSEVNEPLRLKDSVNLSKRFSRVRKVL